MVSSSRGTASRGRSRGYVRTQEIILLCFPCLILSLSHYDAQHALNEPSEVPSLDGRKIPLRCSVDYISFSAHVDYTDNAAFIDEVKAPHVVLYLFISVAIGAFWATLLFSIFLFDYSDCFEKRVNFRCAR